MSAFMEQRVEAAVSAYFKAFDLLPLAPFGVDPAKLAEVLEAAVAAGQPVPPDFDFWGDLPPSACA
ncbi:hypothetical protein [Pelomonas sp. SE-A7]|uniref:hypothetical protein n=1 Tax=Pelomonas sp. SE-A7 TaxID=3054953 RepID=UPI00259C7415|nr:hypothetical protein [Pelomonas sp. SE-A7]MDM4765532.1 hypothetical protein [Pelomonas sp. SE-A7]